MRRPRTAATLAALTLAMALVALGDPAGAFGPGDYTYTVTPTTKGAPVQSVAFLNAGTNLPNNITFHNATRMLFASATLQPGIKKTSPPTTVTPAPVDGPQPCCVDFDGDQGPLPGYDPDADVVGNLNLVGEINVNGMCLTTSLDFLIFWNDPFDGGSAPGQVAETEIPLPTSTVRLPMQILKPKGDDFQKGNHYDMSITIPTFAIVCPGSSVQLTFTFYDHAKRVAMVNGQPGPPQPQFLIPSPSNGVLQVNPSRAGDYHHCMIFDDSVGGGTHTACVNYTITP